MKKKKIILDKKEDMVLSKKFYVEDVDQEKIKAKFKNGVLQVKLPKRVSPKKKTEFYRIVNVTFFFGARHPKESYL